MATSLDYGVPRAQASPLHALLRQAGAIPGRAIRSARARLAARARAVLSGVLSPQERKQIDEIGSVGKGMQLLLALKYQEMRHASVPLPRFADVEFRAYSQNGEDGILLYLFSLLGTADKTCVEICAGNGIECNCANLLINHGWTGLLVDGNPANVEEGRRFYARSRDTFSWPPLFLHSWVTAENVNALIARSGLCGDIDLLSLDMDGMDYWVWRAITCVRPRVVMLEYEATWGPQRSLTRPYRSDFATDGLPYAGASLAAFIKLGRAKGYRLVGCNRYCFNAVFLREDVGPDLFPEVPASSCFDHPRFQVLTSEQIARDGQWIEV